jgi:hypothetical protein
MKVSYILFSGRGADLFGHEAVSVVEKSFKKEYSLGLDKNWG